MKYLLPAPIALAAALYLPTARPQQDSPPAVRAERAKGEQEAQPGAALFVGPPPPPALDPAELKLRAYRTRLAEWRRKLAAELQSHRESTTAPAAPAVGPQEDEGRLHLLQLQRQLELERRLLAQEMARRNGTPTPARKSGVPAAAGAHEGSESRPAGRAPAAGQPTARPASKPAAPILSPPQISKAARALLALGRYDEAHRLFLRDPSPWSQFEAARCLELAGKSAEALPLYKRLADAHPESAVGKEAARSHEFILAMSDIDAVVTASEKTLASLSRSRR